MKLSRSHLDDIQPRNSQRADIIPINGFAMVVDGKLKTNFDDEASATRAGSELRARFPMLQIEVYDATTRVRTKI
jgi:hypothetical protein